MKVLRQVGTYYIPAIPGFMMQSYDTQAFMKPIRTRCGSRSQAPSATLEPARAPCDLVSKHRTAPTLPHAADIV